jgi:hypothetical protein
MFPAGEGAWGAPLAVLNVHPGTWLKYSGALSETGGGRAGGCTRQARPQPLARAAKDVAHHFDLCDKPSPLAESSTGVTDGRLDFIRLQALYRTSIPPIYFYDTTYP